MSNAEYVLEAVDITKTFPGVKALDGVSLRVKPGTLSLIHIFRIMTTEKENEQWQK